MRHARSIAIAGLVVGIASAIWAAQVRNKVGGGYLAYSVSDEAPGPVTFSHLSHGKAAAGFDCSACHPAVAKKRGALTKQTVHEGNACARCHDGKTKGPRSGKVAPSIDECKSCHMPAEDSVIKVDSIGDVPFSHLKHTGALIDGKVVQYGGQACGDCHKALFAAKNGLSVAMTYPHGTDSCGTCHNGETTSPSSGKPVFTANSANCRRCHIEPATGHPCRKGATDN